MLGSLALLRKVQHLRLGVREGVMVLSVLIDTVSAREPFCINKLPKVLFVEKSVACKLLISKMIPPAGVSFCSESTMTPDRPFETLQEARERVLRFVRWYNEEHRHSGLKYITPNQRHRGEATPLLTRRVVVCQAARARHPQRWSRGIRNWKLEPVVYLNPERAPKECRQAA